MDKFMARPLAWIKGHMFVFRKHAHLQLWFWGSMPNNHSLQGGCFVEECGSRPLAGWGHLSPHCCHPVCPSPHLRMVRHGPLQHLSPHSAPQPHESPLKESSRAGSPYIQRACGHCGLGSVSTPWAVTGWQRPPSSGDSPLYSSANVVPRAGWVKSNSWPNGRTWSWVLFN